MIPLRLHLSNFMSYGEETPEIDFTSFRLACLSGENGHGKSALLDAITWALWGKARAGDDDLVRKGQPSMVVEFEFEVDDRQYRVVRKRSLARKGSNHTELQTITETGEYRSLTGQGERETQAKLNDLLHMEYDTFINSAILLQGRADEFTRQRPARRKEILSQILDLGRYDSLEQQAKDRCRIAVEQARICKLQIEERQREIDRKPEYQKALAEAEVVASQAQADLEASVARLNAVKDQQTRLSGQLDLLRELRKQEDSYRQSAAKERARADELRKLMAELDEKLKQRSTLEQQVKTLRTARQMHDALEEARELHEKALCQERALEAELLKKRHAVELEKRAAETSLQSVRQRADQAGKVAQELEKLQSSSEPVPDLEKRLDDLKSRHDEVNQQGQTASAALEILSQQLEGIPARRTLLEKPSAECPVCQQPLRPHDHERLLRSLEEEQRQLEERQALLRREQQEVEAAKALLVKQGQQVRKLLTKAREVEQEVTCMVRELAEAQAAAAQLSTAAAKVEKFGSILAGDLDPVITRELREAREAREKAGYDAVRHQELKRTIRQLESAERDLQSLENAAERREYAAQQQAETEARAVSSEAEARKLSERTAPLSGLEEHLKELDRQLRELDAERDYLARAWSAAGDAVAQRNSDLQKCLLQEEQQKAQREELNAASKDAAVYRELATAFGKRGIQAMIIENVIPELEDEANRLLSRMTDTGMRIQFPTQRELKSGGGTETLDIIIGDDLGDRPYECYSGGEAFRINFAIRIALSRLLARRAGARLQTIVIDEGFGSQDAQGRMRLVEAIRSIREEFAKIIVVTHLDDIKDEFPVRLHVVKEDRGSRVMVFD